MNNNDEFAQQIQESLEIIFWSGAYPNNEEYLKKFACRVLDFFQNVFQFEGTKKFQDECAFLFGGKN